MFIACDRTATKNEIKSALLDLAAQAGHPLSIAKADKLANAFKKGKYDAELQYILDYSDPTGETAVNNVLEMAA